MKRTSQIWKSFLAFLCIILMLAYISVVFFPHSHSTCNTDCALCNLLQTSREILGALAFCSLACYLVAVLVRICVHTGILPTRDATLVGLKVKLSD